MLVRKYASGLHFVQVNDLSKNRLLPLLIAGRIFDLFLNARAPRRVKWRSLA